MLSDMSISWACWPLEGSDCEHPVELLVVVAVVAGAGAGGASELVAAAAESRTASARADTGPGFSMVVGVRGDFVASIVVSRVLQVSSIN